MTAMEDVSAKKHRAEDPVLKEENCVVTTDVCILTSRITTGIVMEDVSLLIHHAMEPVLRDI